MKKGTSKILRRCFAVILFLIGLVLILFSKINEQNVYAKLVENIGLAFLVAGTVDIFRSIFQWSQEKSELEQLINESLSNALSCQTGLCQVTKTRRNYDGYYSWAVNTTNQNLFFAGRSVLHRIQSDLWNRRHVDCEQIIIRKMREGSNFKILFLDPQFDLIGKLAKDEHQTEQKMLEDIATSFGIVYRIYKLAENEKCSIPGQIYVKVYSDIPYFAYHREDNKVIVGFYFHTALGCDTCGFEVRDNSTKLHFEDHFVKTFSDSATLLKVADDGKYFNKEKYNKCRTFLLSKAIDSKKLDEIMPQCT